MLLTDTEAYKTIARTGSTYEMLDKMQTREDLYKTLRYHDYESLDSSIVATVLPHIGQSGC